MKRLLGIMALAALLWVRAEGIREQTLLVLGDSIAAGYGLDPDEAFPALLEQRAVAEGWKLKVVNAGLSGDTSAGGLRRISWLLRQPVDILLIELGGNDGLRGIAPEETAKNLQGIIDKMRAKNPEAKVMIAGMQMPNNMGQEYTTKFREVYPALARTNQAALVPFLLEGVGGKAQLNQEDRIHPTVEGQRLVASNVWTVLEPLLRPARAGAASSAAQGGPNEK